MLSGLKQQLLNEKIYEIISEQLFDWRFFGRYLIECKDVERMEIESPNDRESNIRYILNTARKKYKEKFEEKLFKALIDIRRADIKSEIIKFQNISSQ